MLRTRLKIEPETGLDMYLGCNQSKGAVTLGNGHRVTTVTYDMEQFLRCVDRNLEVAGGVKLNKVVTPGTHEETKDDVSRRPAKEGCNWCNNLVPADGSALHPDQREGTPELAMKEPVRGHLAPHAASVLMKARGLLASICCGKYIAWHETCTGGLIPTLGAYTI